MLDASPISQPQHAGVGTPGNQNSKAPPPSAQQACLTPPKA